MKKIRSFIAVEISEEQREKIKQIIEEFRRGVGTGISYVKPENLHITLRFLGDLDEQKIGEVKRKLKEISLEIKRFKLSLKGIGTFPNLNYIKVLWVGVNIGAEELKKLREKVEEIEVGEHDRREFIAHVTFARIKFLKDKEKVKDLIVKFKDRDFGESEISEIVLKKSDLEPSGAIYSNLAKFKLTS